MAERDRRGDGATERAWLDGVPLSTGAVAEEEPARRSEVAR